MPVRPVSHFTWQVLRTAKRSKKQLTGRDLRLSPTRNTKDGSFLTVLVDEGLLARVTGDAEAPFEAVYALTEKGQHAAEFGEYEYELKPRPPAAERPAKVPVKSAKKKKK
ncbi:MAG TPA: hypothetical protein VGE74_08270 [Gemmata sp.]